METGFQFWTNLSTILSGIGAIGAIVVAVIVYRGQQRSNQRQMIIPLWEYLANLNDIDPDAPITPNIIKAANTLELVALCCENDVVEEAIILRTFENKYAYFYDRIVRCDTIAGLNKTGKELLKENPATTVFYNKLEAIRLKRNQPQ